MVLSSLLPLFHFLLRLTDISQQSQHSLSVVALPTATAVHSHFLIPAKQHEYNFFQHLLLLYKHPTHTGFINYTLLFSCRYESYTQVNQAHNIMLKKSDFDSDTEISYMESGSLQDPYVYSFRATVHHMLSPARWTCLVVVPTIIWTIVHIKCGDVWHHHMSCVNNPSSETLH